MPNQFRYLEVIKKENIGIKKGILKSLTPLMTEVWIAVFCLAVIKHGHVFIKSLSYTLRLTFVG